MKMRESGGSAGQRNNPRRRHSDGAATRRRCSNESSLPTVRGRRKKYKNLIFAMSKINADNSMKTAAAGK